MEPAPQSVLDQIRRRLDRSHYALWLERIIVAFWPLFSIKISALSLFLFGFQADYISFTIWGICTALSAWRGFRQFKRPMIEDALARMDAPYPTRPLAALCDVNTVTADPVSQALWDEHLREMANIAQKIPAVNPRINLNKPDPFALRHLAMTLFIAAALFGESDPRRDVSQQEPATLLTDPNWEGWATPPAYTGLPRLYLNEIYDVLLRLPVGTELQFRFYTQDKLTDFKQNISDDIKNDTQGLRVFVLEKNGDVQLGDRLWRFYVVQDVAPKIIAPDTISALDSGGLSYAFTTEDDYGVTSGTVRIALDLARVERLYGLAAAPDAHPDIALALPLAPRLIGGAGEIVVQKSNVQEDLSQHIFANMPVMLSLSVQDGAGQITSAPPLKVTLPGRAFFDPRAAALIEMRRDILWSAENTRRSSRILRALQNAVPNLGIAAPIALLETTPPKRNEAAKALWDLAVKIEASHAKNAQERLNRAKERLNEAMRQGASPSERDRLMREYQEALQNHLKNLPQSDAIPAPDAPQMKAEDIAQLLEKLKNLLEDGQFDQAQELLETLENMMRNAQASPQNGGQQGETGRSLSQTLREQQDLADDVFGQLQSSESPQTSSLAERQNTLKDQTQTALNGQMDEAGRDALSRGVQSMQDAQDALSRGQLAEALRKQAQALLDLRTAIEATRSSLEDISDPLGRETGAAGQSDAEIADQQSREADQLLNEIRRRAAERSRPQSERDYLNRLLERF